MPWMRKIRALEIVAPLRYDLQPMIQKLDRLKQLGQVHKGPSLAAPMLAITTRSNELNEKNPQPNSALVSNC